MAEAAVIKAAEGTAIATCVVEPVVAVVVEVLFVETPPHSYKEPRIEHLSMGFDNITFRKIPDGVLA